MTSTQQRVTRALIIGALAVAAWATTEAANHADADAADKPGKVIEQPRGILDHRPAAQLPAQASDRAKQAHALLADVQPAEQPNPPLAEPEPIPAISGLLDPQGAPTPTPAAEKPPAVQAEPIPQPDPLPWMIDTPTPAEPADCDRPPNDSAHDPVRQLVDTLTGDDHPATGQRCQHDSPHPATPDAVGQQQPGGKPPADITTGIPTHALNRLEHVRARSQLPGSRHVAIEPGPA